MEKRREFGNCGERLAAEFLEAKGFQILARQWKTSIGELDLVAEVGGVLVFIEVKTRKSVAFGYPEESVTASKLHKLRMLGEMYCKARRWNGPCRIDVVAITLGSKPEIKHLEAVQ